MSMDATVETDTISPALLHLDLMERPCYYGSGDLTSDCWLDGELEGFFASLDTANNDASLAQFSNSSMPLMRTGDESQEQEGNWPAGPISEDQLCGGCELESFLDRHLDQTAPDVNSHLDIRSPTNEAFPLLSKPSLQIDECESDSSWNTLDVADREIQTHLDDMKTRRSWQVFITDPLQPRRRRLIHAMAHFRDLNHVTIDDTKEARVLITKANIALPSERLGKRKCWNEADHHLSMDPLSLNMYILGEMSFSKVQDIMIANSLTPPISWMCLPNGVRPFYFGYAAIFRNAGDAANVWQRRTNPGLIDLNLGYKRWENPRGKPRTATLDPGSSRSNIELSGRQARKPVSGRNRTRSNESNGYSSSASCASSKRSFSNYLADVTTETSNLSISSPPTSAELCRDFEAAIDAETPFTEFQMPDSDREKTPKARPLPPITAAHKFELEHYGSEFSRRRVASKEVPGVRNRIDNPLPSGVTPAAPTDGMRGRTSSDSVQPVESIDELYRVIYAPLEEQNGGLSNYPDDPHPKRQKFPRRPGGYPCRELGCTKVFDYNGDRTKHELIHRPEAEYEHGCRWCQKRFINKKDATRHEKRHPRSWLPGK